MNWRSVGMSVITSSMPSKSKSAGSEYTPIQNSCASGRRLLQLRRGPGRRFFPKSDRTISRNPIGLFAESCRVLLVLLVIRSSYPIGYQCRLRMCLGTMTKTFTRHQYHICRRFWYPIGYIRKRLLPIGIPIGLKYHRTGPGMRFFTNRLTNW